MAHSRRSEGTRRDAYIELMRNTPLLLQIYLIYFGLPLLGLYPSEFACGVVGIALQHAAFLVEILARRRSSPSASASGRRPAPSACAGSPPSATSSCRRPF